MIGGCIQRWLATKISPGVIYEHLAAPNATAAIRDHEEETRARQG